ncbi:hypothetical protein [Mesorhizobium caraganae]|uniref:hypothetical protein n=1 Tax=Mesorhizobium caraganae TaxID=483206 RepID=UPI003334E863
MTRYPELSAVPVFKDREVLYAKQLNDAFAASRAYSEFFGLRAGSAGLFQPAAAGFNKLDLRPTTGELTVQNLCGVDERGRFFFLAEGGLKPKRGTMGIAVRFDGETPTLSVEMDDGFPVARRRGNTWQLEARLSALSAVPAVQEAFDAAASAANDWRKRLLDPTRISDRTEGQAAAIVVMSIDVAFAPDACVIGCAAALTRLATLATVADQALGADAGALAPLMRAPGPFVAEAVDWLKLWTDAFELTGLMGRLLSPKRALPTRVDASRRGPRGQVTTIVDLSGTEATSVLVNFGARPDAAHYGVVIGTEEPRLRVLPGGNRVAGAPGEWKYRIDLTDPKEKKRARELQIFGPEGVRATVIDT